uniref:Uncharacterized protein n=1 Tax=Bosea sp. NBC_00436 TaxID=2969620 RepID=A0A9E8CQ93_9HYPH
MVPSQRLRHEPRHAGGNTTGACHCGMGSVNRYDEAKKQDQNIACVGFDPRTGDGLADARLIAAAPDLLEAAKRVLDRGYAIRRRSS